MSLINFSIGSGEEHPLDPGQDIVDPGFPVIAGAEMPLPALPWLSINGDISYSLLPSVTGTTVSMIGINTGPGITIDFHPRWTFSVSLGAGAYFGFFNEPVTNETNNALENQQGESSCFSGGCGLDFYLSPVCSMGAYISSLNYYFGIPENNMEYIHTICGELGGVVRLDGFRNI